MAPVKKPENRPLLTTIVVLAFLSPVTNGSAWSDTALPGVDTRAPTPQQLPAGKPAPGRYPPPPPPTQYWQASPWGPSPWSYRQTAPAYRSGGEYERLLKELEAYRTELGKARKDLQLGQIAIQEARTALDQAQTEHRQDLDMQNALSERLATATAETVSMQSRVTQLGNELETVNALLAEHQQQAAQLIEERDQLQSALASRDEQLAILQDALQTATAELELAGAGKEISRQQLAESQAQAQTYKHQLDELNTRLEDQQQAMLQARQQLAEMNTARDSLRADLTASTEELGRVQATLEKAQTQAEQLQQARLNPPVTDTVQTAEVPRQAESTLPDAEPVVAKSSTSLPDAPVEVAALESAAPIVPAAPEDAPPEIEAEQVVASAGTGASDTDNDGIPDNTDLCPATTTDIAVESTGCAISAIIPLEGVNFRYNSHELTTSARLVLDRVADMLGRQADARFEVAGHTDSQGNPVYNQWLSQQRAQAVRDYLITRGLNPDTISARGYGDQQPVADNTTVAGLVQNRRVELRSLP